MTSRRMVTIVKPLGIIILRDKLSQKNETVIRCFYPSRTMKKRMQMNPLLFQVGVVTLHSNI